jgi:hypothetical protein
MEETRRPTPADYLKRNELAQDENQMDEYVDFMNSIDWSSSLIGEEGNHGLKNALGEVIIPVHYEDFAILSDAEISIGDPIATKKDGKWGVLEAGLEEKWLVQPQFDYVGHPARFFSVRLEDKWGIYELETGDYKVPPICDQVEMLPGFVFMNGLGCYTINGKKGLIDDDGQLTAALFDEVDLEPDENVKVRIGSKWGFVNEKGVLTEDEDEAYFNCFI